MDKYELKVIMDRINEIENEQLKCLDYICDKIEFMVDVQRENVMEKMLQLKYKKERLMVYIK